MARGGAREAPPVESRAPAGAVGPHVSHKPCNCENQYLWKFVCVDLWICDFWYFCVCKHVTYVLAIAPAPLRVISSDDDDDRKWQKRWWCCWCHHPLIVRPRLFQGGTFFYSSDSFARPFPWVKSKNSNGRKLNSCEEDPQVARKKTWLNIQPTWTK